MPVDEMLTRWTIRLALLLYVAAIAAILLSRRRVQFQTPLPSRERLGEGQFLEAFTPLPTARLSSPQASPPEGRGVLQRRLVAFLREARIAWTGGCVCLWLHLGAAFHFYHDWSHRAAYEDTARDTAVAIGAPLGEGVYLNYLFVAVWTADAISWWRRGPLAPLVRPAWHNWLVHGYLLFIVFNATVTFGEGALRWIAAGMFGALAALAWRAKWPVAE
jgi:hypothetical protein